MPRASTARRPSLSTWWSSRKDLAGGLYAALPAPFNAGTYLWGYKINGGASTFPSATIGGHRGTATTVTYTNSPRPGTSGAPLFLQQRLVTDLSVHSADPLGFGRQDSARASRPCRPPVFGIYQMPVPPSPSARCRGPVLDFDGMPDTWFTPGIVVQGPGICRIVLTYPDTQEATTLSFHDHALGLTRQHVYAGLVGFYRFATPTTPAPRESRCPARGRLRERVRRWRTSIRPRRPALFSGRPGGQRCRAQRRRAPIRPITTPTGSRSSSAVHHRQRQSHRR